MSRTRLAAAAVLVVLAAVAAAAAHDALSWHAALDRGDRRLR